MCTVSAFRHCTAQSDVKSAAKNPNNVPVIISLIIINDGTTLSIKKMENLPKKTTVPRTEKTSKRTFSYQIKGTKISFSKLQSL